MKKLLSLVVLMCSATFAFAQYSYSETGANGNVILQGQFNSDPGLLANDSKQTIGQKMAAVHKIGVWKYWFDNGTLSAEEHYDNSGNRIGVWKTWHSNGTLATEINFATQTAVFYNASGLKIEEGGMNADMTRIGEWKGWHDNGKLNYSGKYDTNGNKKGTWLFYDANGVSTGTENW